MTMFTIPGSLFLSILLISTAVAAPNPLRSHEVYKGKHYQANTPTVSVDRENHIAMADEFFGEVLEDFYVSRARDMCMSLPSLITPTVAPALTSQPSTYTFVPSKALPALTTEDPALTASPTPQSSDASNRPTPIWTPSSSGPSTSGMSKVPQSPFVPTATPRVESSQSPTQLGLSPRQPQSIPTTNNFPNQSIRPSQILLPPTPRPFTTASGRPSFNQSITPIPTVFPQGGRQVFGCSPEGDIQLEQLFSDNVSGIPFNVSYRVESLAATEVFLEELELQILVIALAGALQCNNDGSLFNNETPNVPMNTANTGEACEAPVSGCEILQTEFQVWVNNNLLSDVAAFLGYLSLREKMDDGGILDIMPILDNIEYIRPLPLLPPIVDDDEDAESPGNDDKATNRDSVSPWTLGAVSAMSVGGLIALAVWSRNRRTRNRRHMELIEDMSVGSPSNA